jgi:hypothetical protein
MSNPDYRIFDTQVWKEIAARQEEERKELQLREFYRNLTEKDKQFFSILHIKWSVNSD